MATVEKHQPPIYFPFDSILNNWEVDWYSKILNILGVIGESNGGAIPRTSPIDSIHVSKGIVYLYPEIKGELNNFPVKYLFLDNQDLNKTILGK